MQKTKNSRPYYKMMMPMIKVLCVFVMALGISSFNIHKHPFHVGVIDIKFEPKAAHLQVSLKFFINDVEGAVKKASAKNIDLIHPKNKNDVEKELSQYIEKRFSIAVNSKPTPLEFIGYEIEDDAVWMYLESQKINTPKKMSIQSKLLYDYLPLQSNIINADVNGIKKSKKVKNPEYVIDFQF